MFTFHKLVSLAHTSRHYAWALSTGRALASEASLTVKQPLPIPMCKGCLSDVRRFLSTWRVTAKAATDTSQLLSVCPQVQGHALRKEVL